MHNKTCYGVNPYSRLSEQIIMCVILLNSLLIFIDAFGVKSPLLILLDTLCSLFFIVEMYLKMRIDGFTGYWKNGWNRLDGVLVILSIPSLLTLFLPTTDISVILIFRLLRTFRFFRMIHFFPGVAQLGMNFKKALKESASLFAGYTIVILIFALFSTSLFGHIAPQYFGNPMDSIYSIFKLFTIEGWYEIPDAIAKSYGYWGIVLTRIYFVVLLVIGGVIGLSLINSVFVDAMVSDNNDDLFKKITEIEAKLDILLEQKDNNADAEEKTPYENN